MKPKSPWAMKICGVCEDEICYTSICSKCAHKLYDLGIALPHPLASFQDLRDWKKTMKDGSDWRE